MQFERNEAPFLRATTDIPSMMRQVLYALIPAALAYTWYFGSGFVFNLIIAGIFCLLGEAMMLKLRNRPAREPLTDYSALVTASLIAFALPALTPWWVTAAAALFGIVVAKHLYGGLGYNLFNPAMAGYVMALVAFPMDMNLWTVPRMDDLDYHVMTITETAQFVMTGTLPEYLGLDVISRATPLDVVKAGLNDMQTFEELRAFPIMGDFGGHGWELIGSFMAIGGGWLLFRKIIRWQIPFGVLAGLLIPSSLAYFLAPEINPTPGFHLFTGGTILCAFFIATDPVSAATSTHGRLVYGLGIGFLIYAIREWGRYADGVAFAVLLMNMAVPAIDYMTKPRIVGHSRVSGGDRP